MAQQVEVATRPLSSALGVEETLVFQAGGGDHARRPAVEALVCVPRSRHQAEKERGAAPVIMSTRYHKAAIDGYLDLLKEGTRKDLNTPDEDGMTPTLWAAFHGHLEALQLICSRGGDPDRSDIWGNTPLHHAASNGHLYILNFLANFGANLFALDNDFHTAMDVAASKDRMECVRFLDSAASQQSSQNPRKVAKLKEQAARDAERRVKLCEKVKKRHESRMSKRQERDWGTVSESSSSSLSGAGSVGRAGEQFSRLIAADASGSLTARLKGTLQRKFGRKDSRTAPAERPGDGNVIFVKQENGSAGRPGFLEVFNEQDESEEEEEEGAGRGWRQEGEEESGEEPKPIKESIFKRPGLGNMVFRKHFSLDMDTEPEEISYGGDLEDMGFRIREELFQSDTDGLADEGDRDELPWNEEDIGLDEEDEETSPLAAFLASLGLVEFTPVFSREQLDLEALMLCSDDDLKSIRVQLGPRKKILDAAVRRKQALRQPGALADRPL
ncbi:ankyrin repeat and SAM domain-containing protein 4B [Lepisosteus oculatus]|uniref:ankyrin repeat and SAM domain-containing protein 4B n=1 Tax=Lepisosteus oculatus TaxID=7918 RepID=UPI0035F4FF8D